VPPPSDERIVGRNRVAGPAAHIDAQDLAELVGQVLRVGRDTGVAGIYVEKPVRSEPEPSGIVAAGGGGPDIEHELAGPVRHVGVRRHLVAEHFIFLGRRGAVDVEQSVAGIVRIEREAEQPALERVVDRDGEERRGEHLARIQIHDLDRAVLLDDEQPVQVTGRRRDGDRQREAASDNPRRRDRGGRVGGIRIEAVDQVAARRSGQRGAGIAAGHDVHRHVSLRVEAPARRDCARSTARRSVRLHRARSNRAGNRSRPAIAPHLRRGPCGGQPAWKKSGKDFGNLAAFRRLQSHLP